jgi:serine/threonine-protein kinase HipA
MDPQADEFRISIAGAQEKMAFLWHNKQWCRPLGTTPTSHIFKLPIGLIESQNMDLRDSCENEWLCAQIAKAYGLPVAECFICCFEEVKVLVTKRFDRQLSHDGCWIIRLPQEDMCQALGYPSHLKYQEDGGPGIKKIMEVLSASEHAVMDRKYFFQSQILFWLLAGIDSHAKNFSLFINPHGRYQLTPLYDIMSAYPLLVKKTIRITKN